jgi:hypothetical protein
MAASLLILISIAAMGQLYLGDLYNLNGISYGTFVPGPTFLDDSQAALRAFGAMSLLSYIGIWLIKMNFMILFHRVGHQVPLYRACWWIVLIIIAAIFVVEIALTQFGCVFGDIRYVISSCTTRDSVGRLYKFYVVACALDVLTDVLREFCSTGLPHCSVSYH